MSAAKTLFEKVWESHLVAEPADEPTLLYIDLHLVHEVTSPQAFEGLRLAGRPLRRPDRTVATVDHNVPTTANRLIIEDAIAAKQIDTLRKNCADFGVELYDVESPNQGIVHVIGPELGLTKPGMTIVCGDSHTSTHGAFGALAFGIGTSEVEHVMATQCLPQSKPKTFRITVDGELPDGVTAKDVVLGIIGRIGTDGATGYVDRIRRLRHPLAQHGRPDDHLQHEHRGRRARRHDRSRRDHLRLPQGPQVFAARCRVGQGRRRMAQAHLRSRRKVRSRTHDPRHRARSLRDLGHQPGHGRVRSPIPFPLLPTPHPTPTAATSSALSSTWI